MIHFLLENAPENVPYPTHALFIQDGNALFHAMTNLSPIFGAICLHVLDQMKSKNQQGSQQNVFLANEDNKNHLCDSIAGVGKQGSSISSQQKWNVGCGGGWKGLSVEISC